MRKTAILTAALLSLAACNGSDAASTTAAATTTSSAPTTTEAPPTTPAPTTTAPPTTTAAPTTAAPSTTVPADPTEAAKAEVAARYEEFSVAANECVAAGSECDLPTVLGEFAEPDANLYLFYEQRRRQRIEGNWSVQHVEKIERWVDSVQIDGSNALLTGCVIDGQVVVDESGSVVDDETGYREEQTLWTFVDDNWRLEGGITYSRSDDREASSCEF